MNDEIFLKEKNKRYKTKCRTEHIRDFTGGQWKGGGVHPAHFPRPPSKLPLLEPRGKKLPDPDPREPPLVKPRRLGGRLEVRKLVKAGIGCPASDPDS